MSFIFGYRGSNCTSFTLGFFRFGGTVCFSPNHSIDSLCWWRYAVSVCAFPPISSFSLRKHICLLDMNPTVRRKETPSNKKQFVSNVGILLWHHFAFHPSTVLSLTGHGASWRLFFLVSYNTFSFQQLEFPWHAPRTCT